MADTKISALPAASTPLAGTEVVPIVQSGTTKKVSVADLTAGRSVAMKDLAVNATLKSWWSGAVPVQIGQGGVIEGRTSSATYTFGSNYYLDGTLSRKYIGDGAATMYVQNGGDHEWYAAAPGLADATISAFPKLMGLSQSTGNLTNETGNFKIGTAGKGIDFSADAHATGMTSELLDDYEEGTWTPTDASGAGLTFSVDNARYTKIGRQVIASAQLQYPVTADTSSALIGGLPFTTAASTSFSGVISNNATIDGAYLIYGGETSLRVRKISDILTGIQNVALSQKVLFVTVVYIV